MKFLQQPLLVSTGLIGLALAMTGCSTLPQNGAENDNKPMVQNYAQHHGMMEHRMGAADGKAGKMGLWHHKQGGQMDMQARMNRMMTALNLTDAQKTQVQQMHTQHLAQMQQMQTSMQQIDNNIVAQKKAGATAATLVSLYQQKQALMEQGMALHKQHQQQLMSILTPEQQLKFYETQKMMMGINRPMMQKMQQIRPMQQMPNAQMSRAN